MRKMLLNGTSLVIAAMMSTVLFAGNGEGDGKGKKTSVQISGATGVGHYEFFITTSSPESINISDINIQCKDARSTITSISMLATGIVVGVDVKPATGYSNSDDNEVIIYQVVGIDNITGITPAENNNTTYSRMHIDFTQDEGTSTDGDNPAIGNPTASGIIGNDHNNVTITPSTSVVADITIYPNPISSETNVVTVGEILGKSINVMDMTGKIVYTTMVGSEGRSFNLDLSFLKPGIYILNFETENGKIISKRIQKI